MYRASIGGRDAARPRSGAGGTEIDRATEVASSVATRRGGFGATSVLPDAPQVPR